MHRKSGSVAPTYMSVLALLWLVSATACGQVHYRGPGIVLQNAPTRDARVPDAGVTVTDAGLLHDVGVREDAQRAPDTTANVATGECGDALESEQFRLTNQARAAEGLPALSCDLTLVAVARAHSLDMCNRNFVEHVNPDGVDPATRMARAGIRSPGAENVAAGQSTASTVTTHWMRSPGHRRNIVNADFRTLGVGYVRCPSSAFGHMWTQDFAYR